MKSWRNWNIAVVSCLVAAGGLVPAFNLVLDPYSTLGTAGWMKQGYHVNERYGKIEYLIGHPGKHDSYILGSSIMGLFPPEIAQELRPNGKWYNLSFLAGTPPEALRALKALKAQGQNVKEAVFGVDMFAFRKVDDLGAEAWKREHPLVRQESRAYWFWRELLASTFWDGVEKVGHQFNKEPRIGFDITGSGRYYLLNWDREIARDHAGFIDRQLRAKHPADGRLVKSDVVFIQERFLELAELKRWLDANGVKSRFWINPMHRSNMATLSDTSIQEFREKVVAAIGDVPDYTKRVDFCDDDTLFYEWKHFRPVAAAQILREVLGVSDH